MVETLKHYAVLYTPKVLLALIVVVVGFWVINRLVGLLDRRFAKGGMDPTLRPFIRSIIGVGLKITVVISAIGVLGVETTSFIAILGTAGLAIGLALKDSLSNFAGGALLLFFRPFKVGDYIEAQGHAGTVSEIQMFHTILKTPDNKTIIVPNGPLYNGSLTNYSAEPTRRVDLTFGIGYGDDIDKARSVIMGIIAADPRILKDPEPMILVKELADSSVNFTVRVWAPVGEYWNLFFGLTETVKKAFDAHHVTIPFPQRDVHIKSQGV
jgi:small conductance mechanosensitive channel